MTIAEQIIDLKNEHAKWADKHEEMWEEYEKTPWWKFWVRVRLHREMTEVYEKATHLHRRAEALFRMGQILGRPYS